MTVYSSDGTTVLGEIDSEDSGYTNSPEFTPTNSKGVYVKVLPFDGDSEYAGNFAIGWQAVSETSLSSQQATRGTSLSRNAVSGSQAATLFQTAQQSKKHLKRK